MFMENFPKQDTFVAYVDISGLKYLMKNNERRALEALNIFYNSGYNILENKTEKINGIFISDCGILFTRNQQEKIEDFKLLLEVIRKLNKKMLEKDFMTIASICYGEFHYQKRIENQGISKNLIYGDGFVKVYSDSKNDDPKIQPGQCRTIIDGLPEEIKNKIENENEEEIFRLIQKRSNDDDHYYFYWMIDNENNISSFEKKYEDVYNLKFSGILRILKKYRNIQNIY